MRLARDLNVLDQEFIRYVDTAVLLCHTCRVWFPITRGLPVLLSYTTPVHHEFFGQFQLKLATLGLDYSPPFLHPVKGEHFVLNSFSKEWLEYDYDGVIWDLNYEDHEKRLLAELGDTWPKQGLFLEVGCGLGLSTFFAQKHLRGDAIGVDLSLAGMRAAGHFRNHPFLHFVEASAFRLPFAEPIADVVYSHGVLHHTYSTHQAFLAVAPFCRPGGLFYVWLYGIGSTKGSPPRRVAYWLEKAVRPAIGRNLNSVLSKTFLNAISLGYVVVNTFNHVRDNHVQKYDFRKARHAARDRFTPLYAHRQDAPEVCRWFEEAGFENIVQVDWRTMPRSNQDNYRRNTGVRGWRKPCEGLPQ